MPKNQTLIQGQMCQYTGLDWMNHRLCWLISSCAPDNPALSSHPVSDHSFPQKELLRTVAAPFTSKQGFTNQGNWWASMAFHCSSDIWKPWFCFQSLIYIQFGEVYGYEERVQTCSVWRSLGVDMHLYLLHAIESGTVPWLTRKGRAGFKGRDCSNEQS